VKRCPKCQQLTPHERWLCDCGYEFSGTEPEAIPTAGNLSALEPALVSQPPADKLLIAAIGLLVLGPICVVASYPWNIPLAFSGFFSLGLSFALFARRAFLAVSHRALGILIGVLMVLMALASFSMSILAPMGIAYNRP